MTSTATYPNAPGFKTEGTSRQAAAAMAPRARTLRDRVDDLFTSRELTADECAAALGETVLSVRPRLSELVKLRRIEDAGERRRNESGLSATVWRRFRPQQGELL